MYLVDTNIFLELLLEQNRAKQVRRFFTKIDASILNITEFSLYSIGIALLQLKKPTLFLEWLADIKRAGIHLIRLKPVDMKLLTEVATNFKLDFDDAYQYTVAEKYDLQIVSFDQDFDKTKRKRRIPSEIIP
ncbi:type II toxin-antitoxin system VapC family toxin [candidate division WOR-3 bacterium]|nr:type II toxin-antitoxin system VapC family toxin [candidate division WOR-3 bacterium]